LVLEELVYPQQTVTLDLILFLILLPLLAVVMDQERDLVPEQMVVLEAGAEVLARVVLAIHHLLHQAKVTMVEVDQVTVVAEVAVPAR
jgi:hypothetical protein